MIRAPAVVREVTVYTGIVSLRLDLPLYSNLL